MDLMAAKTTAAAPMESAIDSQAIPMDAGERRKRRRARRTSWRSDIWVHCTGSVGLDGTRLEDLDNCSHTQARRSALLSILCLERLVYECGNEPNRHFRERCL